MLLGSAQTRSVAPVGAPAFGAVPDCAVPGVGVLFCAFATALRALVRNKQTRAALNTQLVGPRLSVPAPSVLSACARWARCARYANALLARFRCAPRKSLEPRRLLAAAFDGVE